MVKTQQLDPKTPQCQLEEAGILWGTFVLLASQLWKPRQGSIWGLSLLHCRVQLQRGLL